MSKVLIFFYLESLFFEPELSVKLNSLRNEITSDFYGRKKDHSRGVLRSKQEAERLTKGQTLRNRP